MHRLPTNLNKVMHMIDLKNITLVLTSCGRLDLLQKTVESIHPEILVNTKQNILIDDSGNRSIHEQIESNSFFSNWKKLYNEVNIGQPKSVDKAYSFVDTDYIFHCEDDWIFDYRFDFVQDSIDILKNNNNIMQVTFRKNCPQPITVINNLSIKLPGWNGEWFGFTYNPSILKTEVVRKVQPYSGKSEQMISKKYNELGYLTAFLYGVIDHIGWGRSTNSHQKL